ncbi:MAG: VanZ family protein, partial [Terriglobus sp.]
MPKNNKTTHWFAALALAAWGALLIRVIVFKKIPTIHIGHMRYRFGGSYRTGRPNFVPFKTIGPQLHGRGNVLIAKANLLGNILPFLPVGFLAPFVFRKMTWANAIVFAVGTGLLMEVLEAVFQVGIFDVDDVLLNAFGVLLGYT